MECKGFTMREIFTRRGTY